MERAPTPPCNDIDNDNSPMSNPPFTAVDSQEVPATTTEFLSGTNANRDGTEVPPAATSTAATVPSPLIHDNGHQVISHNSQPPNVSPTSHHEDDNMSAHRKGRWTLDEKVLFLHGLTTYGKGRWKKISIFLPHRSLVQIKSHAQKVLKRQDAGENVYRRLEEHAFRLEGLIKTVFDEQGIRADHMIPQPSPMKKRKGGRGAAAAAANSNKKKPASSHNPFYGQDRYAYFSHAVAARSSGFGYPPPPPPHSHAPYPPPHPYPHGPPPPPHAHPSRAYSPHMFETAPPHPFDAPSRAYSPLPPDASYPHAGAAPPMHGSRANSPYPPEVYYSQHAPPPMHGSRANSPYPPPEGYYAPPPQMHASRAYSPHSFEAPVPLAQQAPLPHAPPKQHPTEAVAAADAGGASTAVAAAALCQLMSCSETTEHAPVPVTARSSDTTGASSSSSSSISMGNGSDSLDNGSSSSAASIPSRQVFFPLDPDPAVVAAVERPRNVVSP